MSTASDRPPEPAAATAEPAAAAAGPGCVRLSELAVGHFARLCDHPGAESSSPRLADLGFVPGTRVRVLRRAPLGDPVELELRGYRICLRQAQLAQLCGVVDSSSP